MLGWMRPVPWKREWEAEALVRALVGSSPLFRDKKKVASERDSLCLRKRVGRRERPQERKS